MKLKGITSNVVTLGFVSFLTDVSSDMVYPLLPLFLTSYLGASTAFVGLVEGFAESTAAFFMLVSGAWADRVKDRTRLILGGYGLSSVSKAFLAMAGSPFVVLAVRFFDRVGKGIRGAPRDALIADSVDPSVRGKAYGLHRSMDHAGAVTGPVIATLLLLWFVKDLRTLFWIAAVPGFLAVALIALRVREVAPERPLSPREAFRLRPPQGRLRVYLAILFLFILSCSSDAFLLLRAGELGVPPAFLPLLWMLHNLVKVLSTLPLGALSDRLGRRRVILFGWVIYAATYLAFAHATQAWHAWALFAVYGLFYGFTEGGERALLADYAERHERGLAFGWYYFIIGLGSLPASLLFGAVWQAYGSAMAFTLSALVSSVAAMALFAFLLKAPSIKKN